MSGGYRDGKGREREGERKQRMGLRGQINNCLEFDQSDNGLRITSTVNCLSLGLPIDEHSAITWLQLGLLPAERSGSFHTAGQLLQSLPRPPPAQQ